MTHLTLASCLLFAAAGDLAVVEVEGQPAGAALDYLGAPLPAETAKASSWI
jgi:hypothetical protein